jgi:hypothetical protein
MRLKYLLTFYNSVTTSATTFSMKTLHFSTQHIFILRIVITINIQL